jgi:hypothetical protein
VTRSGPLADARRLLAGVRHKAAGSCAWCGVPLPRQPEGSWPTRRRYCGDACRKSAAHARRAAADASSPPIVFLAIVLSSAELVVTGARADVRATRDPDLRRAVAQHSRALAVAVWRARILVMAYTHLGGPAGPWLCCTACGEGQVVGRAALGRRCALTTRCPGVLAITVEPRRGWGEAPVED